MVHIPVPLEDYTYLGDRQYNKKGIEKSWVGGDEGRKKIIYIYIYIYIYICKYVHIYICIYIDIC